MKPTYIRLLAALTLIGAFFLPWVTTFFTFSGYELTRDSYQFDQEEYIIFAAVPIGAIFSILLSKFRVGPILTLIVSTPGIFIFIVGSEDYNLEIGVYLSAIALFVLFISLFLRTKKKEASATQHANSETTPHITPSQEKPTAANKQGEFCTECGTKLETDSKYCTECGIKLAG